MKKTFSVEELEERISDINNYYLAKSIENNDLQMIKYWNEILKKYEENLNYLRAL